MTTIPAKNNSVFRWCVQVFLLTVVNFLSGKLALLLAVPPGYATAIWPPAGIGLAATLAYGYRLWPGVWLGSFLINSTIGGFGLVPALLATFSTIQVLLATFLVRRALGEAHYFEGVKQGFQLFFLAGPVSCLIASTLGVAVLVFAENANPAEYYFNVFTWWTGDVLGVLLLTPFCHLLFTAPKSFRQSRFLSATISVVFSVAATVVIFFAAQNAELRKIQNEFDREASTLGTDFEKGLERGKTILSSIQRFYVGSSQVEREEFHSFIANIRAEYPGLQALSWLPRVLESERVAYEKAARAEGFPDFMFTERGPDGQLRPAGSRPEYAPVYFQEPYQGNERSLGFDLLSEPARAGTLHRARDTQRIAATPRIHLVQDQNEGYGVIWVLPVYKNGFPKDSLAQRRENLQGYTCAVFRMNDMVQAFIHSYNAEGFLIRLTDESAEEGEKALFLSRNSSGQESETPLFSWSKILDVGGRKWLLHLSPAPTRVAAYRSWTAWAVLAAGLLFSSLLQAFLFILIGENRRIEKQVGERTSELDQMNQALRREMTEREKSEIEARKLALIVESSQDAIIGKTLQGFITSWNRGAEEVYGYKAEEVINKSISLLIPKDKQYELDEILTKVSKGERIENFETERVRKDGKRIFVSLSISPILRADQTVSGVAVISRDISEKKNIETQLQQAKDTALELARIKAQFMTNMSHEIRTPMNGVVGMTDLLAGTSLSAEQREYVKTIRSCSENLLTLVNDLLDFSRSEAGKLGIEKVDFALRSTLEATLELIAETAKTKKIKFVIKVEPDVHDRLRGDAGRLRQILLGLVGNALKFTEKGQIVVRVFVADETKQTVTLRFEVKDTGIGIAAENTATLFEPFSQADSSSTRRFGGTGLGLAIAKSLTELLGGLIGVESKLGEGSIFWFSLPFEKRDQLSSESKLFDLSKTVKTPKRSEELKHSSRILVVEDNSVNQKVALRQLNKLGYFAFGVGNGKEALEILAEVPFDLILMDCQMPVMDGYTTSIEIRRREGNTRRIPIIAMTAHALSGDREKCLHSGMNDYLTKPVMTEVLQKTLERWLPIPGREPATVLKDETTVDDAVDLKPLAEITEGNAEELHKLLDLYFSNTQEQLAELQSAVRAQVVADVKRLAHKCAGASATCGMNSIATPLRELEFMAQDGRLDNAEEIVDQVNREMRRIKANLDKYVERALA